MGDRLTDAELRAAAARRPGYATYPEYRPGQPERLAPYWRGEPAGQHAGAAPDSPAPACCDMHNANCEPPADLCCNGCTEAGHPDHPTGVPCVLPAVAAPPRWYSHADIWGPETEPAAAADPQPNLILRAARELSEDEAEQIKRSFEVKTAEQGLRLAVLPPSPVFEFSPQRSPGRPWWRRRWNWAVMSGDGGSWWGYCWTLAGARRRTRRAARRAAQ
ncbi:hypothetical protein ACGFI9_12245 [Micromonospora sp. NPDC048930]|uniref:hypothetical protein n=1 Tax=Micromonospora sp. NPDC048930 TaxID=3364261 RepID=UPI0037110A6A